MPTLRTASLGRSVKMKYILISLSLATSLFAGEVPEDVRTASPDGVFQVRVVKVGDTNTMRLEITDKAGKRLFEADPGNRASG